LHSATVGDSAVEATVFGVADLKYDFLIVWRAQRATQSKNHIWIKQRPVFQGDGE
jgi:hypothetical protein